MSVPEVVVEAGDLGQRGGVGGDDAAVGGLGGGKGFECVGLGGGQVVGDAFVDDRQFLPPSRRGACEQQDLDLCGGRQLGQDGVELSGAGFGVVEDDEGGAGELSHDRQRVGGCVG